MGAANEATAVRNRGSPPGPSCPGAELGSEPMSLPDTGTESSICFPNPLGSRFPQIAGTLKQSHRVKGQAGEPQPLPSSPAPAPVSKFTCPRPGLAQPRPLPVSLGIAGEPVGPGEEFPAFPWFLDCCGCSVSFPGPLATGGSGFNQPLNCTQPVCNIGVLPTSREFLHLCKSK